MRLAAYSSVSLLLAAIAIFNAWNQHKQFYPACVYLSMNSASFMALMNLIVPAVIYVGKLLQKVLVGPLRVIEVEHLYERAWFSVSETCLAMTIFRNDFDAQFLVLFSLLLMSKCFHWLLADRVEYVFTIICYLEYLLINHDYLCRCNKLQICLDSSFREQFHWRRCFSFRMPFFSTCALITSI